MSVDGISKSNNDQTRYLKVSNEREKKSLSRNHEQDLNKLKSTQREETEQLRTEHRHQLVAEKERHTEALKRIKEELDRTQRNLDQQKDFLLERGQKTLIEHKNNQESQWLVNEKQFEGKIDEQQVRHKNVMHQANQAFNDEQNSQIISHKDSLSDLGEKSKHDLIEKASQVQQRAAYENKTGEEHLRNLKREKHSQLQDQDSLWKHKIQQQSNTNQLELNRQEKLWKKNFQDQLASHQQIYAQTMSQQKEEIKRQEEQFLKENEKIKTEASSQLVHVLDKTSDPFYRNNSIRPVIDDAGDSYKITINVADHEKDRYLLSGQDRTLTLSFSRDFQQNIKQPDNVSRTRRVESYSQSFFVPQIIKPNSVAKTYDNGVLTFTIKKA